MRMLKRQVTGMEQLAVKRPSCLFLAIKRVPHDGMVNAGLDVNPGSGACAR